MTSLMEDYSEAVMLEGDSPVAVDVSVHVTPASRGRLLVRRKADGNRKGRDDVDALQAVLGKPGGSRRAGDGL